MKYVYNICTQSDLFQACKIQIDALSQTQEYAVQPDRVCMQATMIALSSLPVTSLRSIPSVAANLQGHVGAPAPDGALVASALVKHDLYIYCGHGAGEQYLPAHRLRQLPSCAAALLMGCSSGRLHAAGDYSACGPVLAYLLAGACLSHSTQELP